MLVCKDRSSIDLNIIQLVSEITVDIKATFMSHCTKGIIYGALNVPCNCDYSYCDNIRGRNKDI